MRRMRRIPFFVILWLVLAGPALADWTDFTAGELRVGTTDAVLQLILPTGWVAFADDDGSGGLSDGEIAAHSPELTKRLAARVRLLSDGDAGEPTVRAPSLPPRRLDLATDGRHSTLELYYTWRKPVGALTLRYELFTPGVAGARCEIAVLRDNNIQTLVLAPAQTERAFDGRSPAHRFAMAIQLYGRARLMEWIGVLLMLCGLAYALWSLRPRNKGEQKP